LILTIHCDICGRECDPPTPEQVERSKDSLAGNRRPRLACEGTCYQRARVLEEAETWLRTPFHHEARVKGAGVDCAMLLAEVYERVGLIPRQSPDHYSAQWHLHRDDEKYLPWILANAVETHSAPSPGDIVMFKIGRAWSHAGIVLSWPLIIHAWFQTGVETNDASLDPLRTYPRRFFTLKAWLEGGEE